MSKMANMREIGGCIVVVVRRILLDVSFPLGAQHQPATNLGAHKPANCPTQRGRRVAAVDPALGTVGPIKFSSKTAMAEMMLRI